MPKATHVPTTAGSGPHTSTRRSALRGAAATVVAAAVARLAVAGITQTGDDAALLALDQELASNGEEGSALYRELDGAGVLSGGHPDAAAGWQRVHANTDRFHAILEELAQTRARTPAGLLVKARHVAEELTDGWSGYGEAIATSLIADLEQLAHG